MRWYVYEHYDPFTGETRYVGVGTLNRAWNMQKPANNATRNGGRTVDHYGWLMGLAAAGFTGDQFVRIIARGLTKKEAHGLELRVIAGYNPDRLFNSQSDKLLSLTAEQLQAAKSFRDEKISYAEIAKRIGSSTMTVHRALNNQTKGYRRGQSRTPH